MVSFNYPLSLAHTPSESRVKYFMETLASGYSDMDLGGFDKGKLIEIIAEASPIDSETFDKFDLFEDRFIERQAMRCSAGIYFTDTVRGVPAPGGYISKGKLLKLDSEIPQISRGVPRGSPTQEY